MATSTDSAALGTTSSELVLISGSDEPALGALVCLPAAGGGTAAFKRWRMQFPDDIRVFAVRLPGRESRIRAEPLRRFDEVVDSVTQACHARGFRTVSLFGHCLGALVAHAVAAQLEVVGVQVGTVFVASQASPEQVARRAAPSATDEALWRYLAEIGGTRPEVLADPELRSLLEPMLVADFGLTNSYEWRRWPTLRAGIISFIGESDELVREEQVRRWSEFTQASFAVERVPGGHFFSPEGWDTICRTISTFVSSA